MGLRLVILPYRGVDPRDLDHLARELSFLDMEVRIVGSAEIPANAYHPGRRQHKAHPFLDRGRREEGDKVLGVTDVDLYSGDLNFVFGVAEPGGKAAVISLYRLRLGADEAVFRERVVKEAVHELGHTFGLSHCPDPGCVMRFSNSLEDTDRKGKLFCARCWRRLRGDYGRVAKKRPFYLF